MTNAIEQLRGYRAASGLLVRGNAPAVKLPPEEHRLLTGVLIGAVVGVLVFIFCLVFKVHYKLASQAGWLVGFWLAVSYYLYPILAFFWTVLRHWRLPSHDFLDRFSFWQKLVSNLVIAYFLVAGFYASYPYAVTAWQSHIAPYFQATADKPSKHQREERWQYEKRHRYESARNTPDRHKAVENLRFFVAWFATAFVLGVIFSVWLRQHRHKHPRPKEAIYHQDLPFTLWLGYSTGKLAELSHGAGIAAKQHIALTLEDAAQNIMVLGAIGSGKTTRAIHALLLQLLDQQCGGLIFDIKGDFQKAVLQFSKLTNHPVTIIGANRYRMNLLAGLTPEMAASFLKSVFMLNGKNRTDPFWVDTATELCRNTLGVLSFLPQHYSLQGLYSYLFDMESRLSMDEDVNQLLPTLDEKAKRLLNAYWQYHERIFDKFEEKVKASVNATVAQVLAPFNHPELVDAFCSAGEDTLHMEHVLDGAVYMVDLPLAVWGLGGKVVYTLIKLRFFNVMQQRTSRPDWNQDQPVFFMCDEFQEIVSANKDGLSDLNFWDKSRSSKTIGIISAQAVSSFYAAIGDRDIAHALLQNFRQKICFKTEDSATLNYFYYLTDKVEVAKKTHSSTTGTHKNPDKWFNSTSTSTTTSITYSDKPVINAQLFRRLQQNQAIALFSIEGESMDDVINMLPVYVETESTHEETDTTQ